MLPNLLTTGCLFSGFYSIVAAIDRNFALAGGAIFIAILFDGLDGRVARWTRTESPFGKEYDSLADMVAFGLAPAVLVYQWGVIRIGEYGARVAPVRLDHRVLLCAVRRAAAGAFQYPFRFRRQAILPGTREPVGRGHRGRFRLVLRQVARAGTAGTGAGLRGHRLRRGADGVLIQLPTVSSRSTSPRA